MARGLGCSSDRGRPAATAHAAPCIDARYERVRSKLDDKVNLNDKIGLLNRPYVPGIVGYLNDYKLVLVRVLGEFVWHKHDDTDDFFLVLRGRLTIQLRDRDVVLDAGELFVVPKGVEHCPRGDEETHVLLIEPRGTRNTGDTESRLTAAEIEI